MRLKSLTLKGFKSFPERTRLDFGPGVSVVVGPTGRASRTSPTPCCGRWASSRRWRSAGQSMQDVIFGGGRGVQARSAAEVEIVLDNSDGTVELPLSEISIVRRLDRAGEGGYRLNGARCRLTDVIEVLSDTGLGKETHSVISQGRVEAIVTSKPRERRLLIEEAAGLGKHRKRRRRAQLKLERTQENLDRALDVEREARTRLRPLKRQAEAAELHERLERQTLEARWSARARGARARGGRSCSGAEARVDARAGARASEVRVRLQAVVERRRRAERRADRALRAPRRSSRAASYDARSARDRVGCAREQAEARARRRWRGGSERLERALERSRRRPRRAARGARGPRSPRRGRGRVRPSEEARRTPASGGREPAARELRLGTRSAGERDRRRASSVRCRQSRGERRARGCSSRGARPRRERLARERRFERALAQARWRAASTSRTGAPPGGAGRGASWPSGARRHRAPARPSSSGRLSRLDAAWQQRLRGGARTSARRGGRGRRGRGASSGARAGTARAGEEVAGELRACAGEEAEIQSACARPARLVTEAEVAAQRLRDQAAEAELELRGASPSVCG